MTFRRNNIFMEAITAVRTILGPLQTSSLILGFNLRSALYEINGV